jgi:hypothetical protein
MKKTKKLPTPNLEPEADAFPRKRFFLEMFTRDISLEDCFLDLVDNAIDALLRDTEGDVIADLISIQSRRSAGPLPEISLTVKPELVKVSDNCGGIPRQLALSEAFRFGHSEGHQSGRLGVYGIGLKRAIFKIGTEFSIRSQTPDDGFQIDLDVQKWASRDETSEDWKIPVQFILGSGSKKTAGTEITFRRLRDEVKMRLKDGGLEASLQRSIAQVYAFFLERHVRVRLNGTIVEPIPLPLGTSPEINVGNRTLKSGDVTMQFVAGLAPNGEWRQERAGWYVLCNGRVVVAADKSELTGWGGLRLPTFHSKYRGFMGVALLQAKDALLLPWTTTKRGLNRESSTYQVALREMVAISKPILSFLNKMYPSDLEGQPAEREAASRLQVTDIAVAAATMPSPFTSKPAKPTKDEVRVQYDALKSELTLVRRQLRQPDLAANKIGRITFDYYLESECPK